jgi:hypothetical protein
VRRLSTRERIHLGVFVIALLWGLWTFRGQLGFGPSSRSGPTAAAAGVAAATVASATALPSGRAGPLSRPQSSGHSTSNYTAPDWASDPFHRDWRRTNTVSETPAKAKARPPLRLTAIVVRQDVRYAVINGRVVREGDSILGRTVIRVEPSQVFVLEKGTEVRLSL